MKKFLRFYGFWVVFISFLLIISGISSSFRRVAWGLDINELVKEKPPEPQPKEIIQTKEMLFEICKDHILYNSHNSFGLNISAELRERLNLQGTEWDSDIFRFLGNVTINSYNFYCEKCLDIDSRDCSKKENKDCECYFFRDCYSELVDVLQRILWYYDNASKYESTDYDYGVRNSLLELMEWIGDNEDLKKNVLKFIDDFDKMIEQLYKEKIEQIKTRLAQEKMNLEQEEKQKKEYEQLIKTGKKTIETLEDAMIYYNAKEGSDILSNPPLKSDGKYYVAKGYLDGKEDNFYRAKFESWDGNIYYFMFELPKRGDENKFRIGQYLAIVGKMIDTISYQTVIGDERYMPVFKSVYIK